MEGDQGIDHGGHGDDGEEGSGDATDSVAEVEQAHRQTAENDGEVEPGEESPLIGKEDFRLNASREGDALACRIGNVRSGSGIINASRWTRRFVSYPIQRGAKHHVPGAV